MEWFTQPYIKEEDAEAPSIDIDALLNNLMSFEIKRAPVEEEEEDGDPYTGPKIEDYIHLGTKAFNKKIVDMRLSVEQIRSLKAERRRIKNARAARKRRVKVNDSIEDLRKKVEFLSKENESLRTSLSEALKELRGVGRKAKKKATQGPLAPIST